jgi:hypothetical protein
MSSTPRDNIKNYSMSFLTRHTSDSRAGVPASSTLSKSSIDIAVAQLVCELPQSSKVLD